MKEVVLCFRITVKAKNTKRELLKKSVEEVLHTTAAAIEEVFQSEEITVDIESDS